MNVYSEGYNPQEDNLASKGFCQILAKLSNVSSKKHSGMKDGRENLGWGIYIDDKT